MRMGVGVRVEEGRGIGPGGLKAHRCSRCGRRRTSGRALWGRWFCIRAARCFVRARRAGAGMRILIFLEGSLI